MDELRFQSRRPTALELDQELLMFKLDQELHKVPLIRVELPTPEEVQQQQQQRRDSEDSGVFCEEGESNNAAAAAASVPSSPEAGNKGRGSLSG